MIAALVATLALAAQPIELKTAGHHPMKYYLSLPEGWSAAKKWPVIVAIESAEREFQATAEVLAKARKNRPFIIVVPMVATDGGPGYRSVPTYRYSPQVWDQVDRDPYRFDLDGLAAVIDDVHRLYGGESKFFLTGFEAGAHTLFAVTFRHPEWLRASAPIAPNYQGRGMDAGFSADPSRATLPIREFRGKDDRLANEAGPFSRQWESGKKAALEHGFRNVSEQIVPGKGHVWLADEVMSYFASLGF